MNDSSERTSAFMTDSIRIPIDSEAQILTARREARSLAARLGFWSVEQSFIAMAISEVALNILQYAGKGEIVLDVIEKNDAKGILVLARDEGPGISDIELAMQEGYSTGGGAGLASRAPSA